MGEVVVKIEEDRTETYYRRLGEVEGTASYFLRMALNLEEEGPCKDSVTPREEMRVRFSGTAVLDEDKTRIEFTPNGTTGPGEDFIVVVKCDRFEDAPSALRVALRRAEMLGPLD